MVSFLLTMLFGPLGLMYTFPRDKSKILGITALSSVLIIYHFPGVLFGLILFITEAKIGDFSNLISEYDFPVDEFRHLKFQFIVIHLFARFISAAIGQTAIKNETYILNTGIPLSLDRIALHIISYTVFFVFIFCSVYAVYDLLIP